MSRRWEYAWIALTVTAAIVVGYGWCSVAHADIVGGWNLNERHDGTTLHDDSGNGYVGHRGRSVIVNGHDHRFPAIDRGLYQPSRVNTVPDADGLDPGTADFTVKVRFKWPKDHDNNLVQKGQGDPTGGMFKMKTSVLGQEPVQPRGGIKCLFRGQDQDSQVESWPKIGRLDDSEWHTVVCKRDATGTTMWVDGVRADHNDKAPGSISNDWPISIGGNRWCEGEGLECNYWWGRIDYVRWFIG